MSQATVRSPLPIPTYKDGTAEHPVSSADDLAVVLRCLVHQLTPFSPQPASRQAQLLARYIAILHNCQLRLDQVGNTTPRTLLESGTITTAGLVNLGWIRPFVDCQSVVTFPGLALSKLAYGSCTLAEAENAFEPQTFSGADEDSGEVPTNPSSPHHPVFPSATSHLFVWHELQQILTDVAQKELPRSKLAHPHIAPSAALFSSELTNNERTCSLPSREPFFVRLRIQNPFPFPMVLHNLCLSLGQIKLRPNFSPPFSDKFHCSVIPEVILNPTTLADSPAKSEEIKQPICVLDLQVLPGPEVESFAVEGIKFELSAPDTQSDQQPRTTDPDQSAPSIFAFVPISARGKRLFKTKEQRISKHYAADNRLKIKVQPDPTPLLSFRALGGDPSLMHAITRFQPVEGYCDQIVQMVLEVENVGHVSISQLRFCTNQLEQISIDEPLGTSEGTSRWAQCPIRSRPTSLFADDPFGAREIGMEMVAVGQFGKISRGSPLAVGGKTGIRIAIRMGGQPQLFYFLFWYIGEHGHSRQFPFAVRTLPISRIFTAHLRLLSAPIGLHLLDLHCLPLSSRDENAPSSPFIKLELLRVSARYIGDQGESTGNATTIKRVDNKLVQLESGTRQNLCFYALRDNGGGDGQITGAGGWALLWLGQTFVPDIPEWQIARFPPKLPHEIGQIADQQTKKTEGVLFQLKLLWKASIVRNDGTVSTVFGEKVADQK